MARDLMRRTSKNYTKPLISLFALPRRPPVPLGGLWQAAAVQRFLPCCFLAQGAAGREQPLPRASSSYRETQRESVTARAPPWRGRGGKHSSWSGASKPKPDLWTVLQAICINWIAKTPDWSSKWSHSNRSCFRPGPRTGLSRSI